MIISPLQRTELLELVNDALGTLYANDLYLIENQVHERSIVFRFCYYLQPLLQGNGYTHYNLDVEYNKNHLDIKRTTNFLHGTYPDVILHQRGSNQHNLLLIEFKPWWDPDTQRDIRKIKDFTNPNDQYRYALGISVLFGRDRRNVDLTLIQNGEVVQ